MKLIFQKNNTNFPIHFYFEHKSFIIEVKCHNKNKSTFLCIDKETKLALFEYLIHSNLNELINIKREPYEFDSRKIPLSFFIEIEAEYISAEIDSIINTLNSFINKNYVKYIPKLTIFHYYNLLYKNKSINEIQYHSLIQFFIFNDKDNTLNYIYHKPFEDKINQTILFNYIDFSSLDYFKIQLAIRYKPEIIIQNLEFIKQYLDKELIILFFKHYQFYSFDTINDINFKLFFKYIFTYIKQENIYFEEDNFFISFFKQIIKIETIDTTENTIQIKIFQDFLNYIIAINLSKETLNQLVELYIKVNRGYIYDIDSDESIVYQPYFYDIINEWSDKKLVVKLNKNSLLFNTEMTLLYQAYQKNIIPDDNFYDIINRLEPRKFVDIKKALDKYYLKINLKNF